MVRPSPRPDLVSKATRPASKARVCSRQRKSRPILLWVALLAESSVPPPTTTGSEGHLFRQLRSLSDRTVEDDHRDRRPRYSDRHARRKKVNNPGVDDYPSFDENLPCPRSGQYSHRHSLRFLIAFNVLLCMATALYSRRQTWLLPKLLDHRHFSGENVS